MPILSTRRHPLRIAIQNWEHDFNIGSIVRTANAFNVAGVHIIGTAALEPPRRDGHRPLSRRVAPSLGHCLRRTDSVRWLCHHRRRQSGGCGAAWIARSCQQQTCLVFGSEGPGLTDELVAVCEQLVAITQYGSTRSLNAGAAAAIAMYHWALRWAH